MKKSVSSIAFILFSLFFINASALTITGSSESGTSSSQVVVEFSVKDFDDIISLQGSIEWDETVATYVDVEQYGLTGLSISNFGTSQTSSGSLIVSWYESNLSGITLSDNSVIFAVKFTLSGNSGDYSSVAFSSSPVAIEVINESFNTVSVTKYSGSIDITGTTNPCNTNPVSVSVSSTNTTCGNNNGTATATVSGGTYPYDYSWDNGASTSSATGLAAGTYTVTVTDDNGCTATATATITSGSSTSGCDELFISEYVEGSSNNKAIEIYNPTSSSISLSSYKIVQYSNGSSTGSNITLSGTIAAKEVYVITHTSASSSLLALADQTSGSLTFNGNDVIALTKNGTIIDQVGEIGQSSAWTVGTGSTENYTLVRKSSVTEGQTNWTTGATEWSVYSMDTYTYLGSHTSSCSNSNSSTASAGSDVTICKGESTVLNASGGTLYQWDYSSSLSSLYTATPTATPTATTTYVVDIVDGNGCTVTDEVTVTVNSLPTLTVSSTDETNSQSNGTATVTATGGTGTYTYSWNSSPVQTTATATGLDAGTYTVTVSDGNCSSTKSVTISNTTTTNPCTTNPVSVSAASTNATCGNSNGTATASVSGGTSPFSYSWDNGASTSSATSLAAGSYTVTVTDDNGCTATATATITSTDEPVLSVSSTKETNGQSNGTATVSATGGTGTYTYSWNSSPVQTTSTATGLDAGTYTVTVSDGNCTVSESVTITNVTTTDPCSVTPVSVSVSSTDATCGNNDGTATATVSGGTSPFSYSWDNGKTTSAITGLSAGTYTVTVTDDNGCTASASATITSGNSISGCDELFISEYVEGSSNNKALELYNPTSSSIDLSAYSIKLYNNGNSTVSAIITLSGNIASKDVFVITHTSASSSLIALADKTSGYLSYNGDDVVVLDKNGTTIDKIGVIGQTSVPTVGTGSTENYTLVRKSSVTEGQTNWTTGATEWSVYAMDTYSYLGSHTSTCTNSSSATAGADVTICKGESTVLNASGGTSYQWDYSSSLSSLYSATPTATPTSTTTYTVTITDGNGCSTTDKVTVTVNPLPTLTVSSTDEINSQSNGTATVSATGGTGTYTYSWNSSPVQTTATATGLDAGTYTVTVSDGNCSTTKSVTVSNTTTTNPCTTNPVSVSAASTNATCGNSNGTATASVSGGTSPFSYSWDNGKTTSSISNLAAGSYKITVTDDNGCTASATATITSTDEPVLSVSSTNETNGQSNGTATVSATGGTGTYTYSWNSSPVQTTATATGLDAGTYTVTVSDGNCTVSESVTITNVTTTDPCSVTPVSVSVSSTDATCGNNDGTATATVSGGTSPFSYSWDNGKTTSAITGLSAGTYTVTVTDDNGCAASASATITSGNSISGCDELFISEYVEGSSNNKAIEIYNPTSSSVNLSDYKVVQYSNGSSTASSTITLTGSIAAKDVFIISHTSASSTILALADQTSGSLSYNGNDVVALTKNGNIIDQLGEIGQSSAWTVGTGSTENYTLVRKSSVTEGQTNWTTGATEWNVYAMDTYSYLGSHTSSCTNSSSATAGADVTICKGESTVLNASGGTSYQWNSSNTLSSLTSATPTATPTSTTTYTVTITDGNGCSTTDKVTVTVNLLPTLTVSSTDETNGLSNGTASVTATGGTGTYTYSWNTNPVQTTATATGLEAGTFTVTVSDGNCSTTKSVTVKNTTTTDPCTTNPPSVNLGADIVLCWGTSTTLSAGSGFASYLWSNGATTQIITASTAETFIVTVTDQNGCTATDKIEVSFSAYPKVDLGGDIVLCQNASTVLDASKGYATYLWSTGKKTSKIIVDTIGTYFVSVTDTNGCPSSDTIVVSTNMNTITGCNELYLSEYLEGSSNNKAVEIYNPTSGSIDLSIYAIVLYSNGSTTASSTIGLKGLLAGQDVHVLANTSSSADILNVTDQTSGSLNYNGNDVVALTKNGQIIDQIGEIGQSVAWTVGSGNTENYTLVRNSGVTEGQTNWTVGATEWDLYAMDTYTYLGNHTSICAFSQKPDAGNDVTICKGDTVQLEAKGGKTYEWYTSSSLSNVNIANPLATPTVTTTYYIDIIDINGCKYTDSLTVHVNPITFVNLGSDVTLCQQTHKLDAGSGYNTYLWSDGSTQQTLTITASGVYSVLVSNSYGCTSTDEIKVYLMGGQSVKLGNDTSVCSTDPISLNAGSGFTSYVWSNGSTTQTIIISQSGIYSVAVMDTNGCTSKDSIKVVLGGGVNLGNNQILCNGNSITLNAGSGYASYLWSNGDTTQTIMVSSAGNYSVTTVDIAACTSTDSIDLSVDTEPVVSLGNDTSICNGGVVLADAGLNYTSYLWSNGDTTQFTEIKNAGTYIIEVIKSNGCVSTDSIIVGAYSVTPINLGTTQYLCQSESIVLDAGSGYMAYSWSNGSTDPTITIHASGYYYVVATDSNGCTTSGGIEVLQHATAAVSLGNDTVLCQGSELKLNAGTGYNSYSWSTGSTAQTITVTTTGTYYVMVEDSNGCVSIDTIHVSPCSSGINEQLESINVQLYPNPVTEQLNINMTSGNMGMNKIEIYNSIGELVSVAVLNNARNTTIDFVNKAEGIYSLRIYSGDYIISRMITRIY